MWPPGCVTFRLSNASYCQPSSHDEEEEPSVLPWEEGFDLAGASSSGDLKAEEYAAQNAETESRVVCPPRRARRRNGAED